MSETVEGWKNYETWAIALWIANDREQYEYWNGMAQNLVNLGRHKHDAAVFLCRQMEIEIRPPKIESEPWSAILSSAAREVYWMDIASDLLADKEPVK